MTDNEKTKARQIITDLTAGTKDACEKAQFDLALMILGEETQRRIEEAHRAQIDPMDINGGKAWKPGS